MSALAALTLAGAIVFEALGTLSLRMAGEGSRLWWIAVGAGYVAAFWLLSLTLVQGVPLGVAYGIWAAAGVAIIAVVSRFLFREPLTWVMGLGIVLIAGGVLLVEVGSAA